MSYCSSDGLYLKEPCFLHPLVNPSNKDKSYFAKLQEDCSNDIKRTFRVLQARILIIALPCRHWSKSDMHTIVNACIVLHIMAANEKRPLVKLSARECSDSSRIVGLDKIECCFVPDVNVHRN